MRLNKFLSETGICSRRQADEYIQAGRVSINGMVADLGSQVGKRDRVHIDGRSVGGKRKVVYVALNKPPGITSTTERRVKDNIVDFVNHSERLFPIGRLDKESEGLILMTNDGDIVNKILRVEHGHEKEYVVNVDRPITDALLKAMSGGMYILGTMTLPCQVTRLGERTFRIILTQGLNRQIRRMCEELGYEVTRLKRVRIMNINLGDLRVGQWRDLTEAELKELFDALGYRPAAERLGEQDDTEVRRPPKKPPLQKKGRFGQDGKPVRFSVQSRRDTDKSVGMATTPHQSGFQSKKRYDQAEALDGRRNRDAQGKWKSPAKGGSFQPTKGQGASTGLPERKFPPRRRFEQDEAFNGTPSGWRHRDKEKWPGFAKDGAGMPARSQARGSKPRPHVKSHS